MNNNQNLSIQNSKTAIISFTTNVVYSKERGESPILGKTTIEKSLQSISDNRYKDTIQKIRLSGDENEQQRLKKTLPAFIFSGEFASRADDSIIRHSGFICLDFDKLDDKINDFRDEFINNKYVYAMFLSPRGNGLKILVKIPPIIEDHRLHYKSLEQYFNGITQSAKIDTQCVNIGRLCFLSYDPNIFINENSEVYTHKVENKEFRQLANTPNVTIKKLLKWWHQKFGLTIGSRNTNCFILASSFNQYGIDEYEARNIMSDFVSSDFSLSEINRTIKSAYSKKSLFNTKSFTSVQDEVVKIKVEEIKKEAEDNTDFRSIYDASFIDINKPIEKPPVLLSLGHFVVDSKIIDKEFATQGNFSAIVGQSKSKKSFYKSLLIASFIGCDRYYCGDIVTHNKRSGYIIDIDTEQSTYHAHRTFERVQKIVGGDITNFYKPFALRPYSAKERVEFIDWLIYESDFRNDILWVSIDGVADLVEDFNDIKGSNYVIQKIMEWTKNKNMHLNTVIHSNYGSEKATGHLGSSILKKAETVCNLSSDGEDICAKFTHTRGMPINDIKYGIDEYGLPHIIGNENLESPITKNRSLQNNQYNEAPIDFTYLGDNLEDAPF